MRTGPLRVLIQSQAKLHVGGGPRGFLDLLPFVYTRQEFGAGSHSGSSANLTFPGLS